MDILNSLQSIGFDWQLAAAHLINFLIVVGLLNYFLFDPLKERLAERRETIKKGVADAKEAEKARFQAEEQAQEVVAEAKKEKHDILESAREQAESVKEQAAQEGKERAEEIKEIAHKKIANDRAQMERELEGQVGQLAILAAEKVLEREVDEDDHNQLVAELITTAKNA